MVSSFEELINNIKNSKIASKSLIDLINLNGFSKNKIELLMDTILDNSKYISLISKLNSRIIEKYLDIKLDNEDYYRLLMLTNYMDSKYIIKLINKLKENGDNYHICKFANMVDDTKKKLFLDMVIKSLEPELVYEFAMKVKNIDISLLEDSIIKIGEPSYLYYFARDISGANIKKLESRLLEVYRDADDLVDFSYLDGVNIKILEHCILKSDNPYVITKFASNPKSNLFKIMKKLMKLGNLECLLELAKLERVEDLSDLENYFNVCNNHYYIYKFAKEFESKVDVLRLEKSLLESREDDSVTYQEEKIKKLDSILLFALNIKNCNLDLLEDYIIKSNNYYYINRFYLEVKGDKTRLKNKLLEIKSEMELLKEEYEIRGDIGLDVNVYYDFLKEVLGIEVSNLKEALNLIRTNLVEIINKIGLVNFYLRLDNRYFKVKDEVLERVYDRKIIEFYKSFLKGNMSLEMAMKLDYKYLNQDKKVLKLTKVVDI